MPNIINAIDKQSIHKICSGQVVLDLATAVKELVENSIDAGATSIDVSFKDNGIKRIEVADNGYGIDPSNYETLALKHYTSKISDFEDLEKVETFGFRGEALSSLCALSKLTVITATKDQAPMGVKLEYDQNGILTSKTPISRTVGTTIQLDNIFHSLPVRQQEFKRNIKREYGKALTMMQAYSIIATDIRISVSNQQEKRPIIKVMSTTKNKKTSDNISNIFGSKLVAQIAPFNVNLNSILEQGSIEGFISKPEWGIGRSSSDRQYFYINGRPCVLPKIAKAMNEVYRIFISNQYPVVIANLKMPTDSYDVNVSPDKRTIFIHQENKIIEVLTEQLKEQMEPSRSTFQVNALMALSDKPVESTSITQKADAPAEPLQRNTLFQPVSNKTQTTLTPRLTATKSIANLMSFANPTTSKYKSASTSSNTKRASSSSATLLNHVIKKTRINEDMEVDELAEDDDMQEVSAISANNTVSDTTTNMSLDSVEQEEYQLEESSKESASPVDASIKEEELLASDALTEEYVESVTGISSYSGMWKTVGRILTIDPIDLDKIQQAYQCSTSSLISSGSSDDVAPKVLKNASIKNVSDNNEATKALSRVISKPDFARMQVLGQFNLGFVIACLDDKDLYIIDQHASDEKYNFETLQQTTQIKGQRLLRSPILDLTAAEEHVVMDNLEIFEANGFQVEVLPDNEPTKRIRVTSQPVSKNTMFDKKDFSELIFLINERPGEMVRCSRNRAMFASRACHKAARIGDSLSKRQMTTIVRHMGEIDQPWNCPHGRPTMRHLFNLLELKQLQPKKTIRRPLSFSGTMFKK